MWAIKAIKCSSCSSVKRNSDFMTMTFCKNKNHFHFQLYHSVGWGQLTVPVGVHLPEDLLRPLLRSRLIFGHLHHRGNHLVDRLHASGTQVMLPTQQIDDLMMWYFLFCLLSSTWAWADSLVCAVWRFTCSTDLIWLVLSEALIHNYMWCIQITPQSFLF